MPRAEGGCLCGAVRYATDGALGPVIGCHCEECRRASGHYVAATRVDDAALAIHDADGMLRWYRSSSFAQRGFCGRCGANLFFKRDEAPHTAVMAGTLDGETGLKLESHIYTAEKGDYYTLDDDIPSYPAGR